jgi:transglutaminase/protease-like cytokinesis protein 3
MPAADKRSYAKGALVVYQAFQLALKFVAVDTEATPKSPTSHTANSYRQPNHISTTNKTYRMKLTIFIVLFIMSLQTVFAQKPAVNEYASIDKIALQLPDSLAKTTDQIATYINSNFKTDKDKSRAIFIWVASNIQYDIDNMFAINFYEKDEDKISKPLQTRKGICENYASLFTDICLKSGLKSFRIEGYTKQNGFTDYIPHAWSAALIDTTWFLFDPTWGSGYVNGGKFFKKINNDYFKADPLNLIKSHMPFDYLWQFLNYPITNQEL